MENSKISDEMLQMFFDGELSAEEEEAIRRSLEASPHQASEVAVWDRLRSAMQSASTAWDESVDSEALFARIEKQISQTEEAPALRVIPGGRERRVWGGMAAGFAAAAAILLAVLARPGEHPSTNIVRGSEVLDVDFGEYAGTVFMVEGGAGQPLSVVWINDEEVAIP